MTSREKVRAERFHAQPHATKNAALSIGDIQCSHPIPRPLFKLASHSLRAYTLLLLSLFILLRIGLWIHKHPHSVPAPPHPYHSRSSKLCPPCPNAFHRLRSSKLPLPRMAIQCLVPHIPTQTRLALTPTIPACFPGLASVAEKDLHLWLGASELGLCNIRSVGIQHTVPAVCPKWLFRPVCHIAGSTHPRPHLPISITPYH